MICIIILGLVMSYGNMVTMTGTFEGEKLGYKTLCHGDINGDGFDDLIYTAFCYSTSYPYISVLFGGTTFDNIPDVELTYSPPFIGSFGHVLWSDDLNLDGYDDIIVSNPYEMGGDLDPDEPGEVFVYFGAENISGTCYPDITIPCPPNAINDHEFGLDICTVNFCFTGQQQPDDYPDIVVGCPNEWNHPLSGKVFVYRGPDFETYMELEPPNYVSNRIGKSVTAADFNQDGNEEIVAGGYNYNEDLGMLAIYDHYGMVDWLYYPPPPVTAGNRFGWDLASGDVTNDLYPDLVITAFKSVNSPQVYVSYGHVDWPYTMQLDVSISALHGWEDDFGWCVSCPGDMNNDGIGDVLIGAIQDLCGPGYIAWYFGGDGSIDSEADVVMYGENTEDQFGYSVTTTSGDFNGDGYIDFGVGAPLNDVGAWDAGRVYEYGVLTWQSSHSGALAYNGNRHLVREPNSDNLHVVYSDINGIIYRYSTNGGTDWFSPSFISEGSMPTIALSTDNTPSVAWIDDEGGLWFARQNTTVWDIFRIYDPMPRDPAIYTPPSMVITNSLAGDSVHILITLYREGEKHYGFGAVAEYVFPFQNPNQYDILYIEGGAAPNNKFCQYPSITKDYQEHLHAVWQRTDSICYATRVTDQDWDNWGYICDPYGRESAHPFVETYGDRVFAVWQRAEESDKEDVYTAYRYLDEPDWHWENLSRTTTESKYGVNSSGLVTTFIDEEIPTPPDGGYEVYWKRTPTDPLNNISETPRIDSRYPQTSLRYNQIADNELFVIWQEGNTAPYQIKFEKVYVPDTVPAFFSSLNGDSLPSAYVTSRDTFNDVWAVPVDIGNNVLNYSFYLDPGYTYQVKATLYHEFGGQCKARLKVDNSLDYVVEYSSGVPNSIEAWIPAQLYEDSVIEVSLEKVEGAAVALGPIYIYRYEDGTVPGPPAGVMAYSEHDFLEHTITVTPTVFAQDLSIRLQTDRYIDITACIYDAAGRLICDLGVCRTNTARTIHWSGIDNMGRNVAPGVYFVRLKNIHTNQQHCYKVLKIR